MCSDYLSKLAISWLLYRDDVSLCPRVHQVGFLPLYLVKPKLTAGLVGVLLDLTKGLGLVLMRVNPVWFIAGLSKKINGSPFESKSLIALCTYVSSLWIFFLPSISCSLALSLLQFSLPNSHSFLTPPPRLFLFFIFSDLFSYPTQSEAALCPCQWRLGKFLNRFPPPPTFSLVVLRDGGSTSPSFGIF